MDIKRSGTDPSAKGPPEWFHRHRANYSGRVRLLSELKDRKDGQAL